MTNPSPTKLIANHMIPGVGSIQPEMARTEKGDEPKEGLRIVKAQISDKQICESNWGISAMNR
jgi:hypothetical protein